MQKITNGPNDRPREETIAQTGPGFPDDSGAPIEISEEEVARVRAKLLKQDRPEDDTADPAKSQPKRGGAH